MKRAADFSAESSPAAKRFKAGEDSIPWVPSEIWNLIVQTSALNPNPLQRHILRLVCKQFMNSVDRLPTGTPAPVPDGSMTIRSPFKILRRTFQCQTVHEAATLTVSKIVDDRDQSIRWVFAIRENTDVSLVFQIEDRHYPLSTAMSAGTNVVGDIIEVIDEDESEPAYYRFNGRHYVVISGGDGWFLFWELTPIDECCCELVVYNFHGSKEYNHWTTNSSDRSQISIDVRFPYLCVFGEEDVFLFHLERRAPHPVISFPDGRTTWCDITEIDAPKGIIKIHRQAVFDSDNTDQRIVTNIKPLNTANSTTFVCNLE